MSLNVNVQGGTGGGKKRPLREGRDPWTCKCSDPDQPLADKLNRGYLVRCPDCKTERP